MRDHRGPSYFAMPVYCSLMYLIGDCTSLYMLYLNFISLWRWWYKFNMLVSYGDPNWEIYDDRKAKVPIIVAFCNNTNNMHIFTAIQVISKLSLAKRNKKGGNIRNFWEKVGSLDSLILQSGGDTSISACTLQVRYGACDRVAVSEY